MKFVEFEAPPGTLQCGPDESEMIAGLAQRLMSVLRLRGYRQVMVPVYEPFDLYASLYGPEVRSRLVTFTTDREYALRPDLTAGICRTMAPELSTPPASPIRLAAWGRAYRHERVRRLRGREFHQLGIERLGDSSVGADIEVISLARAALLDVGLPGGVLRVGHSGLRQELLRGYPPKVGYCLDSLSRLRDRLAPPRTGADVVHTGERTPPEQHEDLPSFLAELGRDTGLSFPAGCNPVDWLEAKLREVLADAGAPAKHAEALVNCSWSFASLEGLADSLSPIWSDARERLQIGLGHIEECAKDIDPLVLRYSLGAGRWEGFYTGFTFEIDVPVLGPDVSQVLGGGRYDSIMNRLGAEGSGACGFALGLERLAAALIDLRGAVHVHDRFVGASPVLIAWADPSLMEECANLAETLGRLGCGVAYHERSLAAGQDGPDTGQVAAIAALPGALYRHLVVVDVDDFWVLDLVKETCLKVDGATLCLMFDRRGS